MKTQFIVRIRCEVTKEVVCEDCTYEQAESDPFNYAVSEVEIDQESYEVESVKEAT